VIRLLDDDITPVDVVAEFFQPRCFFEHELIEVVGFFDAAVSDVDG
jgi:hypothetical protein